MASTTYTYHHPIFHPWIGSQYEASDFGCRILVLGESHYGRKEDERHTFTQELTRAYVNRSWSHKFWTVIGQTLIGRPHWEFERADVWHHVAFYNFVQKMVIEPQRTPSDSDRRNASLAFFEVLEVLKPDIVVACGWRLWSWLPDTWEVGAEYRYKDQSVQSRRYRTGENSFAETIAIKHPSSRGYDWQKWHCFTKAVLAKHSTR